MKLVTPQNELVGVNIGQFAPDFIARDLDDKPMSLKTLIKEGDACELPGAGN